MVKGRTVVIMNKDQIISLIKEDQWMMDILRTAKSLNLPDWWICAGFVRSKVWDTLHYYSERTKLPDIDVIYFNPENLSEVEEKKFERMLAYRMPSIPWSVKNQARMHMKNKTFPFASSVDAISKFPETATALGVKLDEQNNLIVAAPCGIRDLIQLEVKPTPFFIEDKERMKIYQERLIKKNWKSTWSKLTVFHIN